MAIADIISLLTLIAVLISFVAVSRSNRRISEGMRISNLQSLIGEMNQLRRIRSDNPSLERAIFEGRKDWSDEEIKKNSMAVQLANIFEWAYFARRDGLIEKDLWDSWVQTWRSVILDSSSMRELFTDQVWTFGRDIKVASVLTKIVQDQGDIPDPCRKNSRLLNWLTGA